MKKNLHVFLSLVLSAFLIFSSSAKAKPEKEVPEPTPMTNVLSGEPTQSPGTWYVGAVPKKKDGSKTPLVFVHGIHGSAENWWKSTRYYGVNDMYKLAYQNGYQTYFVSLYDPEKGAQHQFQNAKILTKQLEKIYEDCGQKVNIVAHSKGGVDAQTAIVYNDAYRYVNKLIMIASPQYGSSLADLAYSWYMGWLGDLLGMKDEGLFALQSGEMEEFRNEIDTHPNIKKAPHYTVSGISWGPYPSGLWLGGLYLSMFGESDGMVNEPNTRLSYGNHLATLDADHDSIRLGSVLFPVIKPVIESKGSATISEPRNKKFARNKTGNQKEQYVYGGELLKGKQYRRSVSVDSSVKEVVFHVMTKSPDVKVTLVSPSGKKYTQNSSMYFLSNGSEMFKDAALQGYRINSPESGSWKVLIQSNEKDAYLLLSSFNGSSTYTVSFSSGSLTNDVPIKVNLVNPQLYNTDNMKVNMKVVKPTGKDITMQSFDTQLQHSSVKGQYTGKIQGVTEAGLYNVTVEIEGKTKEGIPYQRTIIRSVHLGKSLPER